MRAKSFLTLQSGLQGIFECDLLWYSEQFEAEERVKAGEVAAQNERVLLFKDMQGVVDDTREKFSAAFTAALLKWGVQIAEEEVLQPTLVLPDFSGMFSMEQPQVVIPQPRIGTLCMLSRSYKSISSCCRLRESRRPETLCRRRSRSSSSELRVPEVIHACAPDELFVCIRTSICVDRTDSL